MPSKYVYTEIDGRKLRLSNLDKIIYPEVPYTKAEIIQYYLDIAPYYLRYSKDRPTTLIRFPNGINEESFYSKSAPEWTPEWLNKVRIEHSKESIDYLVLSEVSDLAWVANISGLELHPAQMTKDTLENPDHFIFDLDPSENQSFVDIKDIAFKLNAFLLNYNYHPFVKTSGSRGLHLYIPILENYSHEEMVTVVKELAQEFVSLNNDLCTLHLKKDKRKGKLLIDIYRNHKAHTTVAPFSLRAKAKASISMPISWNHLKTMDSSQYYNISNYKNFLEDHGDAWKEWNNVKAALHTFRLKRKNRSLSEIPAALKTYAEKRDFDISKEPLPTLSTSIGNRFVIQLHDASNLHYDLRLEKDGTLLSWAIPKGLPIGKGEKRLAIQTENHPIKYLDFEGEIPENSYGGGEMWIFNEGSFEFIKISNSSYTFKILGGQYSSSYKLYNTKGDQWIIERTENYHSFPAITPAHMLAKQTKVIRSSSKWQYEIKWDGIRVFIIKDDDQITLLSRNGRDISREFPDTISAGHKKIKLHRCILDGELVCLDEDGRPNFSNIISRMHTQGERNVQIASQKNPAILYAFDVIDMDGIDTTKLALQKRQSMLRGIIKSSNLIRISEVFDDGKLLLKAAEKMKLEGIMLKDKDSKYALGARSGYWLKLKFRESQTCKIIGFTEGKGDRKGLFGSLHLVSNENNLLQYRGRVGSGFDVRKMKILLKKFESLVTKIKPITHKVDEENRTTWLNPELSCEIQYASITENGTFREPIFLYLIEN